MNSQQPFSDWRASLPANLQQHPLLQGQDGGAVLAALVAKLDDDRVAMPPKSGVASATGSTLQLPTAEDDEATWSAFYSALGRPESAKDYTFDPDDKPVWYSQTLLEIMRDAMFTAGLTAKQAGLIHDTFLEAVAVQTEAASAVVKGDDGAGNAPGDVNVALLQELSESHGEHLDDVLDAAGGAVTALAIDQSALSALYSTGAGARVISALAAIGENLQEDRLSLSAQGSTRPGATDASAELERLSLDKDHVMAFLNPGHPGHRQARATRSRLIKAAARNSAAGQTANAVGGAGGRR